MDLGGVQYVVGVDIGKRAHMVCALAVPSGALQLASRPLPATRAGYEQLLGQLANWASPAAILVGLEATGVLWEPLYETLRQAGYEVLVLNPRQTVSWSASLGLRAKTDKADAQTLARGLAAGWARASVIPSEFVQSLRTLTRTRRDLVRSQSSLEQQLHNELFMLFPEFELTPLLKASLKSPALLRLVQRYCSADEFAQADVETLTAEMTRLNPKRWTRSHAEALQALARSSIASRRAVDVRRAMARLLAEHLLDLAARIHTLDGLIAELLQQDEASRQLQSIPGVGVQNAAMIRAELGDVTRFAQVDQVIAYAGLDPRTAQSGLHQGQRRISKRGPGALRHALYLATVVAVRVRPEWRARYERLQARGRKKKEALVILSRALLKVVYQLLRTGQSYDAQRLAPARSSA